MAVNERRTIKELLKAELKWQNVLPQFHSSEPFVKPLWRVPPAAFIVYRVAVCAYLNGWLAVISYWASGYASALMYFTAWGYILLCFSTLLLAALTIHREILVRRRRRNRAADRGGGCVAAEAGGYVAVRVGDAGIPDGRSGEPSSSAPLSEDDAEEHEEQEEEEKREREAAHLQTPPDGRDSAEVAAADEPLSPAAGRDEDGCGGTGQSLRRRRRRLGVLVRLAWVTYSIAVTVAPLITFAYFCVVVPLSTAADTELLLNVANLNLHAVNSLVVVVESLLFAIPSRLAFVVYSDAFFAAYVVANVAFWSADRERNVLYPVIGDWGNYWHVGLPLTFVALLVGIPLIHAVHFLKYRLQIAAYERVYKRRYPHDEARAPAAVHQRELSG